MTSYIIEIRIYQNHAWPVESVRRLVTSRILYGLNTRIKEQSTEQTGHRLMCVLHCMQQIWWPQGVATQSIVFA